MTVMLVGGGTGGHITPLLAVAHELKKLRPETRIIAVTDKHNKFQSLLRDSAVIDTVERVNAGKFRRYPNESLVNKVKDINTLALNVRDTYRLSAGTAEAIRIVTRHKPDIIFIKGGFVAVPVGVAAHLKKIPFITHDSDTRPGLANRLIARWAQLHAVGMPEEFYHYPKNLMRYVGIPVPSEYQRVTARMQAAARKELGIPSHKRVVLVTGGSQGAARLNDLIEKAGQGLRAVKDIFILHQTGKGVKPQDSDVYRSFEFSNELYKYSAAADVVVARAGASTLAELAVQGKAVILIPSPYLAGGHQLANAKHLANAQAAISLDEAELLIHPDNLTNAIRTLLDDPAAKERLEQNIAKLAKPDSATEIARLIIGTQA